MQADPKIPLDIDVVHLFTRSDRLAFADRNLYVGAPDFVTVPAAGMLEKDYLASRAALITHTDMGLAAPGTPRGHRARTEDLRQALAAT